MVPLGTDEAISDYFVVSQMNHKIAEIRWIDAVTRGRL